MNWSYAMDRKVSAEELNIRMKRFRAKMDESYPDWQMAIIISKVNQYYFTGTMQDGMLVIQRDEEPVYLVRRSYERALDESQFNPIKPMKSYRDAAEYIKRIPETVYM